MTKPLTPKQEKFAQKYVELSNASEAYRQAYDVGECKDETIWVNACQLLGDTKVTQRVQEIRDELAERNKVTVDSISLELDGAIEMANKLKQPSPAVTGIMGKAKLHGLLIEKQQQIGPVTIKVNDPNDLEL